MNLPRLDRAGDRPPPRYDYAIVACARWEEDAIIEWIEYHRSIGVDHFYIYSNDDAWQTLYLPLRPYLYGPDPIVTYLHWPRPGEQLEIYLNFLDTMKDEVGWACFLDIDEFITLKPHNDLRRFMEDFEQVTDCVYFNWLNFGHNGHASRVPNGVLCHLTRRSRTLDPHTKTLFRTGAIDAAVVRAAHPAAQPLTHFWSSYPLMEMRLCNVLGDDMQYYAESFPQAAQTYLSQDGVAERILASAYVSHFMFKSEEDFCRRAARGGFADQAVWRERYESGAHTDILRGLNEVGDDYLKHYWDGYAAGSVTLRP